MGFQLSLLAVSDSGPILSFANESSAAVKGNQLGGTGGAPPAFDFYHHLIVDLQGVAA
jgi:hypothetical protein